MNLANRITLVRILPIPLLMAVLSLIRNGWRASGRYSGI